MHWLRVPCCDMNMELMLDYILFCDLIFIIKLVILIVKIWRELISQVVTESRMRGCGNKWEVDPETLWGDRRLRPLPPPPTSRS